MRAAIIITATLWLLVATLTRSSGATSNGHDVPRSDIQMTIKKVSGMVFGEAGKQSSRTPTVKSDASTLDQGTRKP